VTGGAGFIGVALSAGLADRFGRVVALDSLLPQVHAAPVRPAGLDPRVDLVVGDVRDPAAWDALLEGFRPHTVIHLAAETGTGQSLRDSTLHTSANVVGMSQMLDAFTRHAAIPARLILASSRAVYGEGAWRRADGTVFYPGQRRAADLDRGRWDFPEAEPLAMDARTVQPQPVSVYAVTKLAQEWLGRTWAAAFGAGFAVVRLQNVYGPGQSLSNPYTGIMSLFCRLARQGRAIPVYEDGVMRRDFVLIDDVAAALLAVVDRPAADGRVLDIGSGEAQTILSAAQAIARHYGAPEPEITGQYRLGDVRHAWADPAAAREVLGFSARYRLADGVARLAEWIERQPDVPAV
jgi:dTDP-L-rhamnose 4-epimerase